ncbi:protein kinase domain-containing protein [Alteromonas gilva]|uniref:Serine/threonine protein kinase n=1 Tax=Alteromonas gilva TaxID=2987522 RepID=A0ABT5L1W2_9ALTE|nr:serine/threonine protein kinase [Alteromonas gilva]MDC8831031.1 serine/threonine protein kinase [Alteromonas gilva]
MTAQGIRHFYIPEEQSVYLLSHADAKKLKDWLALCIRQLENLGYRNISLIGKGAYGFAFGGEDLTGKQLVFKFTRITLPASIQDRLEEEAFMQGLLSHPHIPRVLEFYQRGRQSILMMQRAPGIDLEQLSLRDGPIGPRLIVKMAVQLGRILLYLRQFRLDGNPRPIVHGDIKPSNLVWDERTETLYLIDWGSSVYAQFDEHQQPVQNNVLDLMSGDLQQTNARLGDIYFIGDAQLNGAMSSPRFDEQGLAATLYALASGQSARFAYQVIPPSSLGLPRLMADILTHLLSDNIAEQYAAGDYLLSHLSLLDNIVFGADSASQCEALLPVWVARQRKHIESVVYSSRKSFLRERSDTTTSPQFDSHALSYLNDAQFERYYKNYLDGMGNTEKGFLSAISRLARYPVVGGLVIHWQPEGVYVDSSLNLQNPAAESAFKHAVNNVVTLARAIHRSGIFKCCFFDAKNTLHIERDTATTQFIAAPGICIPFEKSATSLHASEGRVHSYFEDGDDPDEFLTLPQEIMHAIEQLNGIHHTGCIIFEVLAEHLKIHSYYRLLDHSKENQFNALLNEIIAALPLLSGEGTSGFMKLPYKDTRFFEHRARMADKYYPRNPKADGTHFSNTYFSKQ